MVDPKKILENLNDVQKKVVTIVSGPILVLAGAGSGKTRVLTHRIAYLVSQGIGTNRILAVTFTNKAAGEMKERVSLLIPESRDLPWVTTFHSACLKILRRESRAIGINPHFVIYDRPDQLSLLRRCMSNLEISEKFISPQAVLYFIERAKNRLLTPAKFKDDVDNPVDEKIGRIYSLYQEELKKSSAMDFSDLMLNCVRLFDESPQILEVYQEKFYHVMVDEYQDTNTTQYELIKRLVSKRGNLCVVGDDDQSIYRWRGANLGNILDFERDFPNAVVVKLERNYRSTKNILGAADSVVENNIDRKGKKLFTDNEAGDLVSYFEGGDEHSETGFVVRTISDLRDNYQYESSDFAIFYRTNAQSRPFEDELIKEGILYQVIGGVRFYERQEIKDILAYLRVLESQEDSVSILRIINMPPRGVGKKTVEKILDVKKNGDLSLYDALKVSTDESLVSGKAKEGISSFISIIEGLRESVNGGNISNTTMMAISDSGILDYYRSMGTVESEGRVENLREFSAAIMEFEEKNPGANLSDFLDQVALISDVDEMEDTRGKVSLLTLHSAKGLEFPVVFMVGMEEGLFPHSRSMDTHDDMEEERRLCYVGMTRAKERLFLTSARKRRVFGQDRFNSISRFVHEVNPAYIEILSKGPEMGIDVADLKDGYHIDLSYAQEEPGLSEYFKDANWEIRPGARIRHPDFGVGVVKGIEETGGGLKLTVLFSGIGIKKVMTGFVPIELI